MDEPRKGRQTPTQSIVLPYEKTYGNEAIDIYNTTGKKAQEWQERVKSYKPCKLRLVGFFLVLFRRLTGRYPYLVSWQRRTWKIVQKRHNLNVIIIKKCYIWRKIYKHSKKE